MLFNPSIPSPVNSHSIHESPVKKDLKSLNAFIYSFIHVLIYIKTNFTTNTFTYALLDLLKYRNYFWLYLQYLHLSNLTFSSMKLMYLLKMHLSFIFKFFHSICICHIWTITLWGEWNKKSLKILEIVS